MKTFGLIARGVGCITKSCRIKSATATHNTMKVSLLYSCSSLVLLREASSFGPVVSRAFMTSTMLAASSKMDQSFPTWSFDKPCSSMAWNELVPTTLSVASAPSKALAQDADLVMIGVYAPAKEDEADDDEEEDEEEKDIAVTLSGMAKEIDDSLGGALSELMKDNAKEFKNGATAGSTTPTARLITADGKVRHLRMN
jgi:hypothetical protein